MDYEGEIACEDQGLDEVGDEPGRPLRDVRTLVYYYSH